MAARPTRAPYVPAAPIAPYDNDYDYGNAPILEKRVGVVGVRLDKQADSTDNINDPGFNLGNNLKPKYATWKDWVKNNPTDEYMNRGGKRRKSTRYRKIKSKSKRSKRHYKTKRRYRR